MLTEPRRRAYLSAMQVVHWLPRAELPFAAPSRPELLLPVAPVEDIDFEVRPASATNETPVIPQARSGERPKIEIPRPGSVAKPAVKPAEAQEQPAAPRPAPVPPPRFSHGYFLLRNRIAMLVETHSWKEYPVRVRITRNTVHSYGPAVGRMDVRSEVAEFFNRDGLLDYPDSEVRFQPDEVLFTPGSYKEGRSYVLDDHPGMSCGARQQRPFSSGYVRLSSPDPHAVPQVQPNYLSDPRDPPARLHQAAAHRCDL